MQRTDKILYLLSKFETKGFRSDEQDQWIEYSLEICYTVLFSFFIILKS